MVRKMVDAAKQANVSFNCVKFRKVACYVMNVSKSPLGVSGNMLRLLVTSVLLAIYYF